MSRLKLSDFAGSSLKVFLHQDVLGEFATRSRLREGPSDTTLLRMGAQIRLDHEAET